MRFLSSLTPNKESPLRRTARASSPTHSDEPEDILKQRARRRLLGALILVSILVTMLPFIFDNTPAQISHQTNIYIHQPIHSSRTAISPPLSASMQTDTPAPQNRNNVATSNPTQSALSSGEIIMTPIPNKASTNNVQETSEKNAAFVTHPVNSSAHARSYFFVQAGVFISEERAHSWLTKLKANKLPAYIEQKKLPEGERYFLRAGPFAERNLAELAQKRVQTVGLSSIISESR